MKVGLLLPHFSDECTWERLIGYSETIEKLGFDSVWVRDHLGYQAHAFELPGNRFVDPFVTLAAIAGRTTSLRLGTAVCVPFRHPVVTAQLFASLDWISRGRVVVGMGPGNPAKPFEIVDIPYEARIALCKETAEVLRVLAGDVPASYASQYTNFHDVVINPPPRADLSIWYGGGHARSIARAVEYCDGLLTARCPFPMLAAIGERLATEAATAGRQVALGAIPLVVVGETRAEALTEVKDRLPGTASAIKKVWKLESDTIVDIEGGLVLGSVEECAEQFNRFDDYGVELLVVDLRLSMSRFEEAVEEVAHVVERAGIARTAA